MFKVEKGVPIPVARRGTEKKYPFSDLEIGDSFFVSGKLVVTFSGQVSTAAKRMPGRRFTARTVTENGIKGVRVWRTK